MTTVACSDVMRKIEVKECNMIYVVVLFM